MKLIYNHQSISTSLYQPVYIDQFILQQSVPASVTTSDMISLIHMFYKKKRIRLSQNCEVRNEKHQSITITTYSFLSDELAEIFSRSDIGWVSSVPANMTLTKASTDCLRQLGTSLVLNAFLNSTWKLAWTYEHEFPITDWDVTLQLCC